MHVQTCTHNFGLSACPSRLCDQFCSQTSGLWMLIWTLHKLWRGRKAWLGTWASWLHWVAVQSIQMDSLAVPFSYICFLIIMSPTIKSKPLIHGNKSQGWSKASKKMLRPGSGCDLLWLHPVCPYQPWLDQPVRVAYMKIMLHWLISVLSISFNFGYSAFPIRISLFYI